VVRVKIRLLGTGDAPGTPKIGCSCTQCQYALDNKIQRLRTSLLVSHGETTILIDTSPDLRQQLLHAGSPHISAIIWTHGHYDHFMGLGEFYRVQKTPPIYAAEPVIAYCGDIFSFLLNKTVTVEPYIPFLIGDLSLTLIEVTHPPTYTCGVIISDGTTRVGFTSDTNEHLPQQTLDLLTGVDMLFVDGLFPPSFRKVTKHLNINEAEDLAEKLGVKEYRIVHMSHHVPFDYPCQGRDGDEYVF